MNLSKCPVEYVFRHYSVS